ncbi:MAG: DinB family protein [Acidobacteriota bacterium]
MALKDGLLPEFDREMAVARRAIERVDDSKFAWQPHDKSMSLGRLATHIAEIPRWGHTILSEPEFNMVSGAYTPAQAASTAEVLALFDAQVATIRSILETKTDAELTSPWTFKSDGKEVFTMPRIAAWRSWVMNHLIHHRGQLSVYLRQTGAKVPSIYGPSADEA